MGVDRRLSGVEAYEGEEKGGGWGSRRTSNGGLPADDRSPVAVLCYIQASRENK